MKSFEIRDEENENVSVGYVLYYEKGRTFIIELLDSLDEWTAPFLLAALVKKGVYTIPRDISLLWVKERIVPPSRQNIDSILKNHGLKEYDEERFLEISEGRCSQDSLIVKRTDVLPDYVLKRQEKNLTECFPVSKHNLLCFFANGIVKKTDITKLTDFRDIEKIIKNDALFFSCKTGAGGYYATFNDSIDIPAAVLYEAGKTVPLSSEEFKSFIAGNLLDTTDCCETLSCSRQNLFYLQKHGKLSPVKENVKGNLYLKGDVLKRLTF